MEFKLTFTPDEFYYKEAYDEIISSMKLKKYEPYFAGVLILWGIGLYVYDSNGTLGFFPYVFILLGMYELYKVYYSKKKWLKDRMSSGVLGQQIELAFNDSGIIHKGPFSNGEMSWNGIKAIVKTSKGILIKPDNGFSLYLPNGIFTDVKQMDFVLNRKSNKQMDI